MVGGVPGLFGTSRPGRGLIITNSMPREERLKCLLMSICSQVIKVKLYHSNVVEHCYPERSTIKTFNVMGTWNSTTSQ